MKPFLNEDFLLETPAARRLYHDYAERLPIIDYHCHISPAEIAQDKHYADVAEPFLGGDHYKWRLMRACGEPESLITGDAEPYEKFLAFARTLPRCVGNPVYHWTHLELKRYFGCELPLNERNAPAIWEQCSAVLQNGLGVRDMIRRADVTDLNTTDDPLDDLRWHEMLAADETLKVHVRPAWRPELALDPANAAFPGYMERLGAPRTMDALQSKLSERMDFFTAHGCTASDHGVTALRRVECSAAELDAILRKASDGRTLTADEISAYQYALLKFLGGEYARRGWVMELHFGVIRNLNERMMRRVGPNTGFDAIAPTTCAEGLPALLDDLSKAGALPKTVLFSLNPNDSAMLNAVAGCFTEEGVRSAVQQGAAWWFNDSLPGMERQMRAMASTAVLGNFLGMVTDSRSFLSYTRHEYFRRLLCNLLGGWVENGEYPADFDALGELVSDVGYRNAMRFFGYSE